MVTDFSPLKAILSGSIILQTENAEKYQEKIDGSWNATIRTSKPCAFVKVASVSDVVSTVKFCVKNELEICVCAAMNSEFAYVDDAVVIDLSDINSITVDVQSKVAIVGAGAKVGDVDAKTVPHGLVTPLGSYSGLGVAGFTLLGGTGFLTRAFGCTADNVLEFEIVTATGEVLKASKKENDELFWGMKGYGSNFGVVTSITFKLHEIPGHILGGELYYSISNGASAYKAIRDFVRQKADKRISVYMMLHFNDTGPQVICRFLFLGSPRDGEAILSELTEKTKPLENEVKPIPFDQFQKKADWMVPRGRTYYTPLGNFLKELTDDGIDIIFDAVSKAPKPSVMADSNIYITSLGGKLQETTDEENPFPFKRTEFWVGCVVAVQDRNAYEELKSWADTTDQKLSKYGILPQGPEADKVQTRLKKLKQRYDPENVFHQNVNVNPKEE